MIVNDKAGIRIASFNIQKFSALSVMTKANGESKMDLDTILGQGGCPGCDCADTIRRSRNIFEKLL